ncbi:cryptochrome/photolyase family protein [Devosia chinhatensis]|uniref:cryptochrome/photolyase family protein n=1 Tax=Devosia chinhatensis TaxID=429727 RepID=UPI000AFDAD41|nr:deoxyribodipyrimidine photo-lyase [Devosia chinhatensis]
MSKALVWLRNDLRLSDNPALVEGCKLDETIAIYIHATDKGLRPEGGAARWWLNRSLNSVAADLAKIGVKLKVECGLSLDVLKRVAGETGADSVHWNRRYGPDARELDKTIKASLREDGLDVSSHEGNVLAEPWTVETGQGKPYSVFTPFWKTLKAKDIARPLPAPRGKSIKSDAVDTDYVEPAWAEKLQHYWHHGEKAALSALDDFLEDKVEDYPEGRNVPAKDVTSRLSPHLRFGEISAREIWHRALAYAHAKPSKAGAIDKFLSELAWRDFSYHQLYHRDDISKVSMQPKYEGLEWRNAPKQLTAWSKGATGFPIIDAGMRELWETGYMHNRVRMLVASLLTKNMLIDWRRGEDWFWDCLVDADEANNPASWQWVAGSGLDAAPYFRIFNPVTQGERFDGAGDYVRRWVPELGKMPDKWVHKPFEAPEEVLKSAGVVLGRTYPNPVVDLKSTRARALEAVSDL